METNALREIAALADALGAEHGHSRQVCRLALDLFDQTRARHGLEQEDRHLLGVAALLHDIGYAVNPARHHKGAMRRILTLDLPGFSERERNLVACVARYHRKALPKKEHPVYGELPKPDRRRVEVLAALLRLADGLDRCHRSTAQSIRVDWHETGMELVVAQVPMAPGDVTAALKKRDLFERAFGVLVTVRAAAPPGALREGRRELLED